MAVAIPRARTVSARTYLRIAATSTFALFLVITSGAFVRLTGSGLVGSEVTASGHNGAGFAGSGFAGS